MSPNPHTRRSSLVDIRAGERAAVAWGAGSFFCVLAAYYILRPVRETYGAGFTSAELTQSFLWTLAAMVVATPVYSLAVGAIPRRRLLTVMDGFFVVNLLTLWFGLAQTSDPPLWLKKAFFVWLSVFNLYVVTLFWSVAVDCFSSEQGKRLFGVIAAAGTTGAIVGSQLTRLFVRLGRPTEVLLASAGLLVVAILCGDQMRRTASTVGAGDDQSKLKTDDPLDAFRGVIDTARSPFLAGIGLWILLSSVCATGIYVQMLELVREQLPDNAARQSWFANLNTYQNILTLVGQAVGVSWVIRISGVGAALAIPPLVFLTGFVVLGAGARELWIIGAFDVAQRFAGFSFGVPGREVLFTTVARDEKYRAKALADTVLKRAGDALGAALGQAATATTYAVAMLPVAGVSAALAWRLGTAHRKREETALSEGAPR